MTSLMGGKKQPQQTKLQAHGETDKQRLRSSPYRQETVHLLHEMRTPVQWKRTSTLRSSQRKIAQLLLHADVGLFKRIAPLGARGPTVLGTHCLDAVHTAQIVEINTFKDRRHLGLLVVSGFLAVHRCVQLLVSVAHGLPFRSFDALGK